MSDDEVRDAYQAGLRDGEAIGFRKGVDLVVSAALERSSAIDPRRLTVIQAPGSRAPLQELAEMIAQSDRLALQILRPADPADTITPQQAAGRAGVTVSTIRDWIDRFSIGRKAAGRWLVSRAALDMLTNGDAVALGLYLMGDRASPIVRPYMERAGLAA